MRKCVWVYLHMGIVTTDIVVVTVSLLFMCGSTFMLLLCGE